MTVETNLTCESIDGLFRNKIRVIQSVRGYRVNEDAIILTWFARPRSGELILDAGAGCGAIAFGLALRNSSVRVIGVEIQRDLADRAGRGAKLNQFGDRVLMVRGDLRNSDSFFRLRQFDAIVSNPPYHEPGRGRISVEQEKALSKHQLMMPLKDLVRVAGRLIKRDGRFSIIYPAWGMDRLHNATQETGFKLSRMLWIHPHMGAEARHVCMEWRLASEDSQRVEDRLYLYDAGGRRTRNAEAILAGDEISNL